MAKPTSPPDYGKSDTERPGLTYNGYLKVAELKSLQQCLSEPAHHDEPLFIIIHQSYELWFKLILHELDTVVRFMEKGNVRRATFFVRRVVTIMKILVQQIHILETMNPREFLGFRNHLSPASGFQSSQFREIEFMAGQRHPRLLEHFKHDTEAYEQLKKRYGGPSLEQGYYALLRAKGFNMPETGSGASEEEIEAQREQRLSELVRLYHKADEFIDLHELAEALMDLDEQIFLWRMHHVTVVERIIGFKRGTGGSEGVGYLRSTLEKRAFPELWQVRTYLQEPEPEEI
jgi:tryptophan 2,3-dioxygenase